ncbi:MAG: peptidyl-prolyl cis-trans isomerase [Bdellovibrionaceae bacterium]|nr:peptidyl-prolyl cis-trans isomerase [Pseudobdellovibrionaceae bacterium]
MISPWLLKALAPCTIVAVALFSFGCTKGTRKIAQKPVVKVNDHALTSREFANELARRLKDLDAFTAKDPTTVTLAKEEIIRGFIIRTLLSDFAITKGIAVSEADLDREVDRIRSSYPDDLSFRRQLANDGISFSEWRNRLRQNLLERLVFSHLAADIPQPKEDELRQLYDSRSDHFKTPERAQIRQIVVDDRAKAELLLAELKKGADFSDLAKKYSIAPERSSGGLVGWIERGAVDFMDQAFQLQVGKISGIIESPFGFHILKLEKKLPAGKRSFDEVRPLLTQEFLSQKEQALFKSWLDGQIRSAKILRDNDLIDSITVTTKGKND